MLEKKLQKNLFYGINQKGEDLAERFSDCGRVTKKGANQEKTTLHLAAIFGEVEDVRALIESGADVNTADHEGYTPLHLASMMSCTGKVRALIDAGAKVNANRKNSTTPSCIYEGARKY
jgi:ankyrin repeat protein